MFYQLGVANHLFKSEAKVGDRVRFSWKEEKTKKGYLNKNVDMDTFQLLESGASVEKDSGGRAVVKGGPSPKDMRIAYQNAGSKAIEWVKFLHELGIIDLPKNKPQDSLFSHYEVWAEHFYKGIMNDQNLLDMLAEEDDSPDLPS